MADAGAQAAALATNGMNPTSDEPRRPRGVLGFLGVPQRLNLGPLSLSRKGAKSHVRLIQKVAVNERVGFNAGLNVDLDQGSVTPFGDLHCSIPVIKDNEYVQGCQLNINQRRVSLMSKFHVPLGKLSFKGQIGPLYQFSTGKTKLKLDVTPAHTNTKLVLGAGYLLGRPGNSQSVDTHIPFSKELGVTSSIGAVKEREGPLVISLDGCALSVSTQFINRTF